MVDHTGELWPDGGLHDMSFSMEVGLVKVTFSLDRIGSQKMGVLYSTCSFFDFYLSHCYSIAWDRLSNQFFLSVYVCMYVCMYVSVGTLTVAFFNQSSRNLVRTFGVCIGRTD